jgi:pyruvate/2-oxoglutarate dehydrogenase complex dihydrolipoamide acyltransferase (E2) component
MAHEIKIPSVGESIATATLGTWHKADGEYVRAGEVILTIETDKISTELESDRAGILRHLAAAGDELAIGSAVARIEEGEAPAGSEAPAAEPAKTDAAPAAAPAPAGVAEVKATPVAKKIAEGEGIDLAELCGRFPGRAAELKRWLAGTERTITTSLAADIVRAEFQPGHTVDDFHVLAEVGRGAFATVYLARQISIGRIVALKVSGDRGDEAGAG